MKTILLFFLLGFAGSIMAQSGILTFENKEIHLSNLKADDTQTTVTFTVKNTGTKPVIISRILPSFPRMSADWNKSPILPNQSEEIRISFLPMDMPENFNYSITVLSNAQNSREQLQVNGNIIDNPKKPTLRYKTDLSGVKFKDNNINLGKIFIGLTKMDTLYFYNTREKAVAVSTRYTPSYIKVEVFPKLIDPNQKGMLVLTYDTKAKNDYGYTFDSVILKFDEDNSYTNRLTVTANIVEDFSKLSQKDLENAPVAHFDKNTIEFGEINQGEKVDCDFTLENQGKSALIIRKTKASCGCTAITLGENTIAPGQKTVIRATFNSSGKSGRQYKSITVITNDPKNPETNLTISGNVIVKKQ
ncbi:DUF1573 domain-containing protein [Odoribacter lunatus]|uniref:DUF1573 domain-containing protein n=1 Tax=Odoribacter lunatus TaxID=2941335 RepID=UPI00203B0CBB|nr:DUF1573 domain-containing protein [Odoribacter lunatus]